MTVTKFYTLSEVAENNFENGKPCWIVIRDAVYDVTDYLDDHPGGGELITEWAGKDATAGFDDFGHSGDANRMLKDFKIGELVEEDRKANRKKKTDAKKLAKEKEIMANEPIAFKKAASIKLRHRLCFCI